MGDYSRLSKSHVLRRSTRSFPSESSSSVLPENPNQMMCSMVGMLTAASVYNGLANDNGFQNEVKPPQEDEEELEHQSDAIGEKLRKVFHIKDTEFKEYPCWILQDVLLQGNLYLTEKCLLFFAYLPGKPGSVAFSSFLSFSSRRRWAILRNQTLSLFSKPTELYFPNQTIDLRQVLKVSISGSDSFKIVTESQSFTYKADSAQEAEVWVSHLKKQVFASKNSEGYVSIKIPLNKVADFECDSMFENASSLRVKVFDTDYALEEYFFLFFGSVDPLLQDLKDGLDEASPTEDAVTMEEKPVGVSLNRWKKLQNAISSTTSKVWSPVPTHYYMDEESEEDVFLIKEEEILIADTFRFQKHFSLGPEPLVATYFAHLLKNVPIYGKIYIGRRKICFRSLIPGVNTKMILPLHDLENAYHESGFRFGYSGLVIVIHGHEELFFEFGSALSRDDCGKVMLRLLDQKSPLKSPQKSPRQPTTSPPLLTVESQLETVMGKKVPVLKMEPQAAAKSQEAVLSPSKTLKITLLTIGSRGDVQPYIALGLGLIREGHKVKIATHKEFEGWIQSHGIGFAEIAGNPAELMALMVTHGSMSVSFLKEASAKFRGWISELLASCWEACKEETDLLIESPSAMAGIHIAEKLKIPYFRAFTMPWTKTRAYPHAFIVPHHKRGGSYNYLTHVMFENIFWKGISSQVNKWRVETLHLSKTNLTLLQQSKVPFLYNVSPSVFPPSVDFPEWVKVTGYWILNEASTFQPPKELRQFIQSARDREKKIVYIGFGSIVVADPKGLTEQVVEAVVSSGVMCILNKGWSHRLGGCDIEVDLPGQVFNGGTIPHDWLFPQIDAAVHHGGSGTTGCSLFHGLPTVVRPFFGDQFFYASRVEDLGTGINLKEFSAKALSEALVAVVNDEKIKERARALGEKIKAENGVASAIRSLYADFEYSKNLSGCRSLGESDGESDEETGSWLLV